jgi:predicted RNA-binding protein YlqC (UPF0109 family)
MEQDPPARMAAWLVATLTPMLNNDDELQVEHLADSPLPGEHLFVVTAPRRYGGLLVGHRGNTAGAIRILARAFACSIDWAAQIDVRIRKTN